MVKNLPAMKETGDWSVGWEDPWRREWLASPVFLPGEFHGQRSLVGYSPWGGKELDTIEQLTLSLHFQYLRSYFFILSDWILMLLYVCEKAEVRGGMCVYVSCICWPSLWENISLCSVSTLATPPLPDIRLLLSKANELHHRFSCKCYAGSYLNGLNRKNMLPALGCQHVLDSLMWANLVL